MPHSCLIHFVACTVCNSEIRGVMTWSATRSNVCKRVSCAPVRAGIPQGNKCDASPVAAVCGGRQYPVVSKDRTTDGCVGAIGKPAHCGHVGDPRAAAAKSTTLNSVAWLADGPLVGGAAVLFCLQGGPLPPPRPRILLH